MPSELNALPYGGVRVGGGDDVGAGRVDRRVEHERGAVDVVVAVHDLAAMVEQDQVARLDVAEAVAERVDPEQVGELGVAHRDVPGDALAEPEPAEDAQRAGELGLAMGTLLLDAGERRRQRHGQLGLRGQAIPSIIAVDRADVLVGHGHAGDGYARCYSWTPCDTGSVNREIRPSTIAPPAANYAHAMLTEGPARWLHTSGVVPIAPDGSVPPSIGEQAIGVGEHRRDVVRGGDVGRRRRIGHDLCGRRGRSWRR